MASMHWDSWPLRSKLRRLLSQTEPAISLSKLLVRPHDIRTIRNSSRSCLRAHPGQMESNRAANSVCSLPPTKTLACQGLVTLKICRKRASPQPAGGGLGRGVVRMATRVRQSRDPARRVQPGTTANADFQSLDHPELHRRVARLGVATLPQGRPFRAVRDACERLRQRQ